jgi:hypothetical protein
MLEFATAAFVPPKMFEPYRQVELTAGVDPG